MTVPMLPAVYTIGHSIHTLENFFALLRLHAITAIGDVRSRPYSGMNPQFNREVLKQALKKADLAYVFLGDELGGRSDDPACLEDGRVQYERLALTDPFQHGLQRVREGMKTHRLALMCAEKEPLGCHRALLVSRHLCAAGIPVQHILTDGALESHADAMERLLCELRLPECDLFRSHEDVIADAYRMQESRVAYTASSLAAPAGSPAG